MTKGNRKRANVTKVKKVTEPKALPSCEQPNILKDYPVRVLNQNDVNRFKDLVTLSNNVAGLIKQIADAELSIKKGKETAKEMLDGKIKGPALQKVSANLFLPLVDMRDVGRRIKGEIEMIEQATIISKGQLQQRYDEYIDTMRNMERLLGGLLAMAPAKKLTKIVGNRTGVLTESKKDEKVIFEKEIDKLTNEDTELLKKIQLDINKKGKKGK